MSGPWEQYQNANLGPWSQFAPVQEKPEEKGIFEAGIAALKRGFEQFEDIGGGYSIAGSQVVGDKEAVARKMAEAKAEAQRQQQEGGGLTVADLERIYKNKGLVNAAGEVPQFLIEQTLQALPTMAPPLAVGAGVTALTAPLLGPFAPIAGAVAGVGTYGVQQFGSLMKRQALEKQRPEELEVGKAAIGAVAQAPIGYFADRFTVGLGSLGKQSVLEVGKELAARKAAGEIGTFGVATGIGAQAAKGSALGFIAEAPTEALEQVIERWQAGLDLTGDDAYNEYKEAFFGAGAVGGTIGGAGRGRAAYKAYTAEPPKPEKELTPGDLKPKEGPLLLPAPADIVTNERRYDPLTNPLGNFFPDEITKDVANYINKDRFENNKPKLKSFSLEDIVDAMSYEALPDVTKQGYIDTLLTYKTGYKPEYDDRGNLVTFSPGDIANVANQRNISAGELTTDPVTGGLTFGTEGMRDFLTRTTGTDNLSVMTQPQLYSAFKALSDMPAFAEPTVLEPETNAVRFTDKQYINALKGLEVTFDEINTDSLGRTSVIDTIQEFTGLTRRGDAVALYNEAIQRGDLETELTVQNVQGKPTNVVSVKFGGLQQDLPQQFDIRKQSFKQRTEPEYYEIRNGNVTINSDKRITSAQDAEAYLQKQQANQDRLAADLEKGKDSVEALQRRIQAREDQLDLQRAKGLAGTQVFKKLAAHLDAKSKADEAKIRELQDQIAFYRRPLKVVGVGEKPIVEDRYVYYENDKPVAAFGTRAQAQEYGVTRLDDAGVQSLLTIAPEAKGVSPKRLKSFAEQEIRRREKKLPEGIEIVSKGVYKQEVADKVRQLEKDLSPALKRLGLDNVRLKIVDSIANGTADGAYVESLIKIAYDAKDPMGTLRHEGIHALKELGAFTDAEWKVLSNKAKSEWIQTYLKKPGLYAKYQQAYVQANGSIKGFDEYIQEEAIAEAFRDFANTKPPAGLIGQIFSRIKLFMEALGNAFRRSGFQTADSIFERIERGEVRTKAPPAKAAPERLEARGSDPRTEFMEPFSIHEPVEIKGERYSLLQHGSPNDFENIDKNKLGVFAFGYGAYTSVTPGQKKRIAPSDITETAREYSRIDFRNKGYVYLSDIPLNKSNTLNLKKSLEEQQPITQKLFDAGIIEKTTTGFPEYKMSDVYGGKKLYSPYEIQNEIENSLKKQMVESGYPLTGLKGQKEKDIYSYLDDKFDFKKRVSDILKNAGIDAIWAEGMFNDDAYVIVLDPNMFNEHIVGKYELSGNEVKRVSGLELEKDSVFRKIKGLLQTFNKARKTEVADYDSLPETGKERLQIRPQTERYSLALPKEKVNKFFADADKIVEPEGVAIVRENWIGGVAGIGDRNGAYDLPYIDGGKKYMKDVQDLVRKDLGDSFKGYRLMSKEEFEEIQSAAMGTQLASFTLDPMVGLRFSSLPMYARRPKGDLVVVEMDLTPEHIKMIGHLPEREVVVDYGEGYNPEAVIAYASPISPAPLSQKEKLQLRPEEPEKPRKIGARIVGAPPGVTSEQGRTALVKRMTNLLSHPYALLADSKDWYERSGQSIRDFARGNKDLMEKTIRLMALYSQANSLGGNTTATIKSLAQLASGQDTAFAGRFPNKTSQRIPAILAAENFDTNLPGIDDKIMNFYQNLHDAAFNSNLFENSSTVDRWMMRLFGYPHSEDREKGGATGVSATQYKYAKDLIKRIAQKHFEATGERLKPRQVQAVLWTYVKNSTDAAKKEKKGKEFKPSIMDFADYVKRATATITWEARPSEKLDIIPGIHTAPREQQEAFNRAIRSIFENENGSSKVFELLKSGVLYKSNESVGAYENKMVPNTVTQVVLQKDDKGYLTDIANKAAAIFGYVARQDAVPWYRADPTASGKSASAGFKVTAEGVEPDAAFEERLFKHLNKVIPGIGFTRVDNSFDFVNFRDSNQFQEDGVTPNKEFGKPYFMPDKKYEAELKKALESFGENITFKMTPFRAESGYISNKWKENTNGESYLREFSPRELADIQSTLDDWRKAYDSVVEQYGREYGWSRPSESAVRPSAEGDGIILGTRQPGASSFTGRHFGKEKVATLSGSMYGTGIKGAEAQRLAQSRDPAIKKRVYFYVPDEKGKFPPKEAGLGINVYTQKFDNILGPGELMSRLFREVNRDMNDFESMVVKEGFDGYAVPDMGMMVILNKDVPVEFQGKEPDLRAEGRLQIRADFNMNDLPQTKDGYVDTSKTYTIPKGTRLFHGANKERAKDIKKSGRILQARPSVKEGGGLMTEGNLVWFGDEDLARGHSKQEIDLIKVAIVGKKEPGEVFQTVTEKPYKLIGRNYKLSKQEANIVSDALQLPEYKRMSENETVGQAAYRAHDSSPVTPSYRIEGAGRMTAPYPIILKALGYDGYYDASGVAIVAETGIRLGEQGAPMERFQIRAPETPEFKKWFKGSKVVDENGKPLLMYHGTKADINIFDTERGEPEYSQGSWFIRSTSNTYAADENSVMYPVFLSIKNPKILRYPESANAGYDKNKLIRQGYDGIVQYDIYNEAPFIAVAFYPEQIKSAFNQKPTTESKDIRYSLRSQVDPKVWGRVESTTVARKKDGFIQRLLSSIFPDSAADFRFKYINSLEGIERQTRRKGEVFGDQELMAENSALAAALQSMRAAGVAASSFRDGVPVYDKGYTYVSDLEGKVKGLIPVLEPLAKYGDPDVYRLFQYYAGTRRGRRLTAEGREQLFTPEDIQNGKDLEKQYPEFKQVFDEYQKYNAGLVNYMKTTGVISEAEAKIWTQNWDYIPFYRQLQGEKTAGPKVFSALSGVSKPKELKGGTAELDDFLETVVRNARAAIEAGMKNEAARRAVRDAMALGTAVELKEADTGTDIVNVKINGKTTYYRVADPLLVQSMQSLNMPQLELISFLSKPAEILRNFVTKDPGFILANLGRDSLQAWITAGTKMTPIVDTYKEFGRELFKRSPVAVALARAGMTGYDFAGDVKSTAEEVAKALRKVSGTRTGTEKALLPITSLWEALEQGSHASDMATRAAIYKETLERTGSEAEAMYQAMEVLNFSRRGASPTIRMLAAMIPFLNARIQGLDVLYRSGWGKMATENKDVMKKAFAARALTMMGMSIMYWFLVSDTEEYERLTEEERDNYWIVPGLEINGKPFRFPIPFELGVVFKVIPERVLETFFGEGTGKDLKDSMVRQLTSTLGVSPPQAFLPILENVANYSFFTGDPLVGRGLQDLEPQFQFTSGTSMMARDLGAALNMSPIKIENLVRGYTGTLGTYAIQALDEIYRGQGDPVKATLRTEQLPVIKRFFASDSGTVAAYYDLKEQTDIAVRTVNMLERTGDAEGLRAYLEGKGKVYLLRDYVTAIEKDMKQIRDARKIINESKTLDETEKREYLDRLHDMEVAITDRVRMIKKDVLSR